MSGDSCASRAARLKQAAPLQCSADRSLLSCSCCYVHSVHCVCSSAFLQLPAQAEVKLYSCCIVCAAFCVAAAVLQLASCFKTRILQRHVHCPGSMLQVPAAWVL